MNEYELQILFTETIMTTRNDASFILKMNILHNFYTNKC